MSPLTASCSYHLRVPQGLGDTEGSGRVRARDGIEPLTFHYKNLGGPRVNMTMRAHHLGQGPLIMHWMHVFRQALERLCIDSRMFFSCEFNSHSARWSLASQFASV